MHNHKITRPMQKKLDQYYMRQAIAMAQKGAGRTAENPSVGCVVVNGGHIIARARTADGGRPHAEKIAIDRAGDKAKGATLYVTLEPCSHHGQTPPCVDAIIEAGVTRVVYGSSDPDPRVNGRGKSCLEAYNIKVCSGFLERETDEVHLGFITRLVKSRPFIALKLATTLDGKMATSGGDSKWITSDLARHKVHHLRSQYDAILVGVGTVLADNPKLTTRIAGYEHINTVVILDPDLRLNADSFLIENAKSRPVIIFYINDVEGNAKKIIESGVQLVQVPDTKLEHVLGKLAEIGMNSLFVEGGPRVHSAFLLQGYCDKLYWFRAPKIVGGAGMSSFSDVDIEKISESFDFKTIERISLGEDLLEIYKRKP